MLGISLQTVHCVGARATRGKVAHTSSRELEQARRTHHAQNDDQVEEGNQPPAAKTEGSSAENGERDVAAPISVGTRGSYGWCFFVDELRVRFERR